MSAPSVSDSADGLLLTLDIGTSSTRAAPFRAEDGTPFRDIFHAVTHEPTTTPDGGSMLDPEGLLREAIECLQSVLARVGDRPIVGVAVSTLWHSVLGTDAAGRPQTPVLVWSDTRSSAQVAGLKARCDVDAYVQRTGCPLHTSYLPGRLLHLAETEPATFAACARFLSPGEYVFARLFGIDRVTCSYSMASASGLFHQAEGRWDDETLARIPGLTADRFSPVSDAPVSGLLPEWRTLLPALADVPFLPALGDGACSNAGCGAVRPDRLALMIGTSGAMRVMVPGATPPQVPNGLWRYQLDRDSFLLGGALTNGGAVWSWLKETVLLPPLPSDELQKPLAALPPDGHGLTVLPFLSGERAPLWRDDLRAVIHGLSAATTPLEIVRAHLEAVAIRFAILRDALRPVAPTAEIIGTGAGLLSSRAWAQIIADVLGEPIRLSAERQASARGAALVFREKLGLGPVGDAPMAAITDTVLPDLRAHGIYREARTRHERLLERLGDFDRT
ncbi:MAG: gluconokinase [Capsulimonadales bacterium]|nr:gluconokinase [Capsulimonadales bacterium]